MGTAAGALFFGLSAGTRRPFRLGLVIVAGTAVGFALLRRQAPMVAVCVFGLPLLFAVHFWHSDGRSAFPRKSLTLGVPLAIGLGVAWALVAGPITASAYRNALGGQMDVAQVLLCGIAIPMTYGLALVAPTALVRWMEGAGRASLRGFEVGAMTAAVVNAAATATLLVPQLAMGASAASQPVGVLVAEALVEGVAWPLGSAATGGAFGVAMWFRMSRSAQPRYRRSVAVLAALLGAMAFPVAMGLVDVAPLSLIPYVALQLLIAVVTVLAAQAVIALALRNDSSPSRAAAHRLATMRGVLGPVILGMGGAVAVTAVVASLVKPAAPAYTCPPDCGRPPIGKPVEANPRFSGDSGAFSVSYPGEGTAYAVTFDPPGINGVQLKYLAGDTGTITLFGELARGRTPQQIAQEVLRRRFPTAAVSYEIPNASVGYEPGYGVVADVYPRDTSSTYQRLRVIVMTAIRHGYALIATAAGPYHEFSPDYGPGHPSAANLEVAMDMGKYVNSFRWYGDRYGRPS